MTKLSFLILTMIFHAACAHVAVQRGLKLSSTRLEQGSVLTIENCSGPIDDPLLFPNPDRSNCQIGFFAIPFDAPLGPQALTLGGQTISYEVTDARFASERLSVDPDKVKLSPENQERVKQESAEIKAIYGTKESELLFKSKFKLPLSSTQTSTYGIKRLFNGEMKSHHNGVDFRASPGTPIYASNKGRVRLAKDYFLAGNVVLIDHGGGIFTNYCHLSEFKVKEGDEVKRGQIIGLSGTTGRISGPHLHWGLRVHGVEANPLSLLSLRL